MAEVLHGSTIAINTVLEKSGARTALITTAASATSTRSAAATASSAFNLFFHRPEPLVPRELTFEVAERINAAGEVLTPLDEARSRRWDAAGAPRRRGGRGLLPALLRQSGARGRGIGESCAPRCRTCSSRCRHEILREYREYERTSTTVLNAFVGPRVSRYLGRFETFCASERVCRQDQHHALERRRDVDRLAQAQPVAMMESGPVAGMIGAGRLAGLLGIERAIGFDMGGTTAKCTPDHRRRGADRGGLRDRRRGERPADAAAGGRHRRGRRRRRLARLVRRRRRAPCRAGERGRRSGPGLLRPRRRGAGGDRCRSRARPAQRRALPRRRTCARSARSPIGRSAHGARLKLSPSRPRSVSSPSRTAPCRSRCARSRSIAASTRATPR